MSFLIKICPLFVVVVIGIEVIVVNENLVFTFSSSSEQVIVYIAP